jgi:hypothetical protein
MSRKPRVQRTPEETWQIVLEGLKPRNDCSRHRLSCGSGANDGTSPQESDTRTLGLEKTS